MIATFDLTPVGMLRRGHATLRPGQSGGPPGQSRHPVRVGSSRPAFWFGHRARDVTVSSASTAFRPWQASGQEPAGRSPARKLESRRVGLKTRNKRSRRIDRDCKLPRRRRIDLLRLADSLPGLGSRCTGVLRYSESPIGPPAGAAAGARAQPGSHWQSPGERRRPFVMP